MYSTYFTLFTIECDLIKYFEVSIFLQRDQSTFPDWIRKVLNDRKVGI